MAPSSAPCIFSPERRLAARRRMLAMQAAPDAPRYIIDDMVEDVLERLSFVRFTPKTALVIGDYSGALAPALRGQGAKVTETDPAYGFLEDQPWPYENHDLIVSLGTLETVNDLPGALIHARRALAGQGIFIASMMGSGSLPFLREAMLQADADRPAARMHPAVDVRAGAQLLQRASFADPVADHRHIDVRFRTFGRLIQDLRAMGQKSVLADRAPAITKAGLHRAEAAFRAAVSQGGTVERFEILTLSGWKR